MGVSIITKYLGPSNMRGARVKAESSDTNPETGRKDSVTVSWDHALNPFDNHAAAAKALASKMGWDGEWKAGDMPAGYVFIRQSSDGFTV